MMKLENCKGFSCTQCGKCCREIPIDIVASDIIRWYNTGRWDLLKEVSYINNYPKKGKGGFYIAKTTFAPKQPCPFLKENKCGIHNTKPFVCKNAPYAHIDFRICPAFHIDYISDKDRLKALMRERKEFKDTFRNKQDLFNILLEVRSNG